MTRTILDDWRPVGKYPPPQDEPFIGVFNFSDGDREAQVVSYDKNASAYEGPFGRFVYKTQRHERGCIAERCLTHWKPLGPLP
jgi:hypothetical protein